MNLLQNKKFQFLICVIMSFVVYGVSVSYGPNWDDSNHIAENPIYQNIQLADLGFFWTDSYFGLFIPVTYTLWGGIIWIASLLGEFHLANSWHLFHLVNVFVFGVNCFLVYQLFNRFFSQGYSYLGALMYLIHPINTETVVWISEFRILVSNFFILLSLLLMFKSSYSHKFFSLMGLSLVLAVLAKPSAVVILAPITLWYAFRGYLNYKNGLKLFVLTIIVLVPLVYTKILQPDNVVLEVPGLLDRMIISIYSISFYIPKLLVPFEYHHVYAKTPSEITNNLWFIEVIIALLMIALIGWFLKFNKHFWFGVVCYIALVSLNSGIVSFAFQNYSTVANRYAALALIFSIIFILYSMNRLKNFVLKVILCGSFILLCAFSTGSQLADWSSQDRLWSQEVLYSPKLSILWSQLHVSSVSIFKKLGVSYAANEMFQEQYFVDLLIEDLVHLRKMNEADAYLNRKYLPSDSSFFSASSNIAFGRGLFKQALSDYDKSIEGRFTKMKHCSRFYMIALYSEGKDYVLNNLKSCPLNHETGVLSRFKKSVELMQNQFPEPRAGVSEYTHSDLSQSIYETIMKFQKNSDYKEFKVYFESLIEDGLKRHPDNYKAAIVFALKQKDPESAELYLNYFVAHYDFNQDEILLEIARLYARQGKMFEAYLRLKALIAMKSRLSPKAIELLPNVASKELLFYLNS